MNKKNIFVIGAGASKEANLPVGDELKKIIANLLNFSIKAFNELGSGDPQIFATLERISQDKDINTYIQQAHHIRDALPLAISIDNFIDSQRGNDRLAICSKLAIARAILKAENESLLFTGSKYRRSRLPYAEIKFNLKDLDKTWYIPFFKLLTEGCTKEDLVERFQSVVLIIFNYDRCIEQFLINALQISYKITEEEAAKIITNINIYHPYGSVGSLAWQKNDLPISFGGYPSTEELEALITRIKTFTEGTDPESSEIIAIRQHMCNADKLVFLGFAFHKLNMKLISPTDFNNKPKCFATTLNISKSDKLHVGNLVNKLYDNSIHSSDIRMEMTDKSCFDFFSEHWRGLSF